MTSTVFSSTRKESLPATIRFITAEEDELLKNSVPIISDVFYFVRTNLPPSEPRESVFFSTDSELVYDSFFDDFGPLNIAKVYRYCELIESKLKSDRQGRKIVHFSSLKDDRKFLNAAWLVGAYAILKLKRSPEDTFPILERAAQRMLIGFRDASYGPSTYCLNLQDCLAGLHMAIQNKFFDYDAFNLNEYEHYERVENGDFNWITPKLLAFCGPHQKTRTEGYPVHAPEEYFSYFREHNISTIVRLNSPQYPSERFSAAGFDHKDLIFPDGTSPGEEILFEFLRIVESAAGAVAVHCKAGLGRTGTLIAAYLMKHYRFTAAQAIAWTRIARPGSVIGQQQHFLESMRDKLWADGGESVVLSGTAQTKSMETVQVSSTVSSTETIDEKGFRTVVEISMVETTVSTTVSTDSDSTSDFGNNDDGVKTQGDELNLRKAQRSREKLSERQTRSMCRATTSDTINNNNNPVKKKRQNKKKLKIR